MNLTTTLRSIVNRRLSVVAWSTALVAATVALAVDRPKDTTKTAAPTATATRSRAAVTPPENTARFTGSFAPVVKRVSPSVVQVYTSTKPRRVAQFDGPGDGNPFEWFFGPRGMPNARMLPSPARQGIGSGVVVSADGYILTNNHVVDGADDVKVALADGREFDAKIVGRDPKTEVAVLKVDAKDLPHIELADSDQIEVGDLVLAVGNPFGIGQTVTLGMVSAKGRARMGLDYEDFIQTDAAINPGNSGGALVDSEGRLIGINTAILSRSGGNQGIGFAIPTNLARSVMDSLIKDGRVTRGYLGVLIQDVTPAIAKAFKLEDRHGALVGDVTPGGPADKAGLQSGDVILKYNDKAVTDSRHLKLAVAQTKPGSKVPVEIVREGDPITRHVTVKELPGTPALAKTSTASERDEGTLNGVTVGDLDPQTRRALEAPPTLRGAVITDVTQDSAAAEAGLRPGDVILEINRIAVQNADDAVRLTESPKDKTTLLRIWRDGNRHYVVVDESKAG
ncbi:MAG TPA: DegQ family serine endoprotease [Verrucomicrobiota bacterium]|nr:DegQ family serine endoprotease [Verrucomicrobiota bacterium]HNU51233.1 DegQ family serine endoprotease [Verrucomicrobiota bacterium]